MADSPQPPTATPGEQICSRLKAFSGKLETGEPIPCTTVIRQPDGSHTRTKGLLGDNRQETVERAYTAIERLAMAANKTDKPTGITIRVVVVDNVTAEVSVGWAQVATLEFGDKPAMQKLAGQLLAEADATFQITD